MKTVTPVGAAASAAEWPTATGRLGIILPAKDGNIIPLHKTPNKSLEFFNWQSP